MSTIKVFCLLCAAVFLAACSLPIDVYEVFLQDGSRVRLDELGASDPDAGESDAGVAVNDAGETIDDAGGTVDAEDANDAGMDAGSPACSGACLPSIDGWSSPLLVAFGGEPWTIEPCPIGYEPSDLGALDLLASPAACSPCACGTSQGGSCVPSPTIAPIVISDNTCAAVISGSLGGSWGVNSQGGFKDGTCAAVTMIGNSSPVRALYSNAAPIAWQGSPGTCAASGGNATIEPYTWGNHARACVPTTATDETCSAGQTCGSVEPGFSSCIVRVGSHECSAGLERREVYQGASDSRACSSCGCAAPSDETCAWTFDAFDGSNCDGSSLASLDVGPSSPVLCSPIIPAAVVRSVQAHEKPSKGGTCAATGGKPIGNVAPLDPVTICCAP